MRELRGLVVDSERNIGVTVESLDLAFNAFKWHVDWKEFEHALQAQRYVRDHEPFDFAVISLLLADDEPNGLSVVPDIYDRSPDTFTLIVMSSPERDLDFRDKARKAGATYSMARNDLLDGFPVLARKIREHVVSRGLVTLGSFTFDDYDPHVMSVLERLGGFEGTEEDRVKRGGRIVHNLAMRCLDRPGIDEGSFRLSYLTPGRSGAQVCRIDLSMANEPTEAFVLKIGFDRAALEREVRKNQEAHRVFGSRQVLVATQGSVQSDLSGYSAIAASVAEDSETLASWLQGGAEPDAARYVADIIFAEYFKGFFRPELRSRCVLKDWVRPSSRECVRSRLTLETYRSAIEHPDAGSIDYTRDPFRELDMYIKDRKLPVQYYDRLAGNAVFVKSFGDLHSSNILIHSGVHALPVLIDASLFDSGHWSEDAARLLVDLTLRVRNHGVSAMLWGGVKPALAAARALCPHYPHGYPDENTAVDAFIVRIIEQLPLYLRFEELQLVPDQWHWQWHIGLAREFLRQAAYEDVVPPRTVLGLASAAYHLSYGIRLLDNISYG